MKLSLDKTWIECLRMWRWIVKEWKKDGQIDVPTLKRRWVQKYYPHSRIEGCCFFCEYCRAHGDANCEEKCPAMMIDSSFNCHATDYSYFDKPDKFLCKIESLHKKYLKQKKGAKEKIK